MDIDKIGENSSDSVSAIKYNIDWKKFLASGDVNAMPKTSNVSILNEADLKNNPVQKLDAENIKAGEKFFHDENDMEVPGLTSFQFSHPAIKDTLKAVNNCNITICDEEVPL